MKVLPRNFTMDQMDRGETMIYHPVRGEKLSTLQLITTREESVQRSAAAGEWGQSVRYYYVDITIPCHPYFRSQGGALPNISDQNHLKKGDYYPLHWKFDPWTGEDLFAVEKQTLKAKINDALPVIDQCIAASAFEKGTQRELSQIKEDLQRMIVPLK